MALGRTLNLNVVAEGIETRAQQEFLTGIGCASLQGFLLGRPMPAASLMDSLRQADEQARAAKSIRNAPVAPMDWRSKEFPVWQALPQLQS